MMTNKNTLFVTFVSRTTRLMPVFRQIQCIRLSIRFAQVLISLDLAIFLWMTTMVTQLITLPLVHAHGVKKATGGIRTWALSLEGTELNQQTIWTVI